MECPPWLCSITLAETHPNETQPDFVTGIATGTTTGIATGTAWRTDLMECIYDAQDMLMI